VRTEDQQEQCKAISLIGSTGEKPFVVNYLKSVPEKHASHSQQASLTPNKT
jgi:hypothetical protein